MQNQQGLFKDRGSVIEIAKALNLVNLELYVLDWKHGGKPFRICGTRRFSMYRCHPSQDTCIKTPTGNRLWSKTCRGSRTYDECVLVAKDIAQQKAYFLCGDYLLRREGQKTLGGELVRSNFDAFIIPVGNGNIGLAVGKRISELAKKRISQGLSAFKQRS